MSYTVSFSELDTLRQCKAKWQLGYRERWVPEGVAPALSRGKLFHAVMEAHYRRLASQRLQQSTVDEFIAPETLFAGAANEEESALVAWMFDGYLALYEDDKAWEVLDVELRVERWLPTESGRRSSFKLKGVVDLLVIDHSAGGGLWIVDHKTCKNLPKERELDLDDQFGLYMYLLRQPGSTKTLPHLQGVARADGSLDIRGVIHNAVRTEKLKSREMEPKERFARTLTTRTDRELQTVAAEARDTFKSAFRDYNALLKATQNAAENATPGRGSSNQILPRSPNTDTCRWRCQFLEPCLSSRKGRDIRELLDDLNYVLDPQRH
jgi:hypothetical protein